MANRRKFLAGLGALASGSAAAVGTGAFSTSTDGSMSVDVVGPGSAYLGVDGNTTSEYVSQSSPVTIDLASDSGNGGSGLAEMSDTIISPVFTLENNSSESLYVEIHNPLANNDISTSSGPAPAGVDVQFLTAPSLPLRNYNNNTEIALIGRDTAVAENNGLGGGFDDPGSNEYWFHQGPNDVPSNAPNRTPLKEGRGAPAGALEIGTGESYPVVFRVAVQDPGNVSLSSDFHIEAYDSPDSLTYSVINDDESGLWVSE